MIYRQIGFENDNTITIKMLNIGADNPLTSSLKSLLYCEQYSNPCILFFYIFDLAMFNQNAIFWHRECQPENANFSLVMYARLLQSFHLFNPCLLHVQICLHPINNRWTKLNLTLHFFFSINHGPFQISGGSQKRTSLYFNFFGNYNKHNFWVSIWSNCKR